MRRSLLLLPTLAVLATACVEHFNATQLGVPVTMASPAAAPAEGDRFRIRQTSVHALWGIATLKRASLENALATQLVGGRGVADVRITVRSRWLDILFTGLTLGVVVPRSVTFEGVVTGGTTPSTPPP
ncbi:MAG TPA: hypothetical protein VGA42_09175 [Gemmatimonadales bacterium]